MPYIIITLMFLTAIASAILIYLNLQERVMTYLVNADGTIEVLSYDEEPNSLESANEWLATWNEENSDE